MVVFFCTFARFSSEPDGNRLPAYQSSDVLAMVKEMDEQKQTGAGPKRTSEKTGRTQMTAPWMKKSGVRSAYHIYKNADAGVDATDGGRQNAGARQAAVAGSAKPAGAGQQPAQPASHAVTRSLTSGLTPSGSGAHQPAGASHAVTRSLTSGLTPRAGAEKPETPSAGSTGPRSPTSGVHAPMAFKPFPSSSASSMYPDASVSGQSNGKLGPGDQPAASGFRSVSPAFGKDPNQAGASPSVLDRNFNIKPRPFGLSPTQPSHVEAPRGKSLSPPPPTASGSPASAQTGTGPGFSGSKSSRGDSTPDNSGASYSGTEAHGTDSQGNGHAVTKSLMSGLTPGARAAQPDPNTSNPAGNTILVFCNQPLTKH